MKPLQRFHNLPVTLRVPLVTAALMILLGLVASQSVLSTLGRVQDARLAETARLHVEGLSVALGPSVLRQDVWEVYDILDRARAGSEGQRLLLTVVADERGHVLAATDPRRAPIGEDARIFEIGAAAPEAVRMTGDPVLRVTAPLQYQGRTIGSVVTELNVTDLLAERRNVTLWLLVGNALATAVLAFGGWLAVARILRPVGALVQAMDASGGAPRPIPGAEIPHGDPGLARLIETYNQMTTAVGERAEAERRLADRERFVSLGRLSSSLAHEINNPLGGLLNAADTIHTYADRPEVVRQSAELVQRGLGHLRDVTRAILDQNRLDRAGQPLRPEDLEDLRLLFEPEAQSRSQVLAWHVQAGAAALAGHPAAPVRQVALNLLLNAGAAAGVNGRVGLTLANGGDGLSITVSNTGAAMTEADLARLLASGPLPPEAGSACGWCMISWRGLAAGCIMSGRTGRR
ncbi:histidine kinase dimerization/phospho-acceptor domain-containing protein [Frigidibacter mobilis]|uniref:histidine kinase n=1 Tax=Frigidibacter mobilis TaxID=1335048 RepID=A0A161HBZ1_9RHOB|nr:HAMP domain-containing sensor histidine kinase [Frigidibacter mobilis]AMY68849.1 putative sensor histidine kinase [Frigidibacter mobilis]